MGPDVLFPLPVAVLNGFAQLGGEEVARISFCITIVSGMTVFTANNDCCFTRLMIIYQRQDLLDFTFSPKGFVMVILGNVFFAACVAPPLYYAINQNEFVFEEIRKQNLSHFLRQYEFDTTVVFVTMDIYSGKAYPIAIITGFGLAAFYICNLTASILTMWKVSSAREHLSEASYKLQRQLSIMLILQNIYPIVAISIPVLIVSIVVTHWEQGSNPWFLFRIPYVTIAFYPLVSGLLSFCYVRPYRNFLYEKLFCRDDSDVHIIVERTESMQRTPVA